MRWRSSRRNCRPSPRTISFGAWMREGRRNLRALLTQPARQAGGQPLRDLDRGEQMLARPDQDFDGSFAHRLQRDGDVRALADRLDPAGILVDVLEQASPLGFLE